MRKKVLLSVMALAVAAVSCQKDPAGGEVPAGGTVVISPVITKVTDVNFEDGDQIGLSILKDGAYYAENYMLSFADGVFSGALTWYPEAAQASDLIAYYPYSGAGMPETFTVQTDQTAGGYEASDLIAGTKTGVTPTVSAVTMQFRHLLTKILLNIDNQSGAGIVSARISGARLSADVDLQNLSVTVDGASDAQDVTMQAVTAGSQYRAIVIPQSAALTLTVTTVTGKTLEQKLAEAELKAGGQYTVEATVIDDELSVAISGEISGWTDEGQIGSGDQPAEEVQFEEYDGYFIYDGERYNTVTLADGSVWMAEPMRYLPDGCTPSADPASDSHVWYPYELENDGEISSINATRAVALTDAESIKTNGYLYDFYAALDTDEITPENAASFEGTQGICPPGWHVPTREDFFGLCGLSNKDDSGTETGNQIDENALFYDAVYGGGKLALYNEAGWNYVLSGVRMKSNYAATPQYQRTQLYPGNTTLEDMYGEPGLTYILSSTFYKGTDTYLQFFVQMTTFTSVYPEGRINVAYSHIETGGQLRCVKD